MNITNILIKPFHSIFREATFSFLLETLVPGKNINALEAKSHLKKSTSFLFRIINCHCYVFKGLKNVFKCRCSNLG